MSACSTTPSPPPPREVTTRDVTAVCPAVEPIIDRSFAADEPECLARFVPGFRFDDGDVIAGIGVQAVDPIATLENCLSDVKDWLADEKEARGQ